MNCNEKINFVITKKLKPLLQERGFKRKGSVFFNDFENGLEMLEVEKDRFNSKERAGFSLNFGIYIPRVNQIVGMLEQPPIPDLLACISFEFIERLTGKKNQLWTVTSNTDVEDLSDSVQSHVFDFILPWFKSRRDLRVCFLDNLKEGNEDRMSALLTYMNEIDPDVYADFIVKNKSETS